MKLKDKGNETLQLHTAPIQPHAEDTFANRTPSREEIRFRAYEIHLERGAAKGKRIFDQGRDSMKRRDFIKDSTVSALAIGAASHTFEPGTFGSERPPVSLPQGESKGSFWPDGARLVVSISMQMEAGAQPLSGAESPMPKLDPMYPDLPAAKWYEYGFKEGVPRLLDMFDRRKVKVTSHMVGATVDLHPVLAKEIVQRGHEASGHGQTWSAQYSMTPEQERESYNQSVASIELATGTKPLGFNAFWLRGTPHTLEILQELGFLYHIDDVSRDEPFLINVKGKPFAVVPYTLHMNDIGPKPLIYIEFNNLVGPGPNGGAEWTQSTGANPFS